MDTNRIAGALKEAAGRTRETVGKLAGDREVEVRGTAQRIEGAGQRRFGEMFDRIRDVVRDRPIVAIATAAALALIVGAGSRARA